ncbi:hypothetical protein AB0D98_19465 [Streptomyces sp. NPDC047987]
MEPPYGEGDRAFAATVLPGLLEMFGLLTRAEARTAVVGAFTATTV